MVKHKRDDMNYVNPNPHRHSGRVEVKPETETAAQHACKITSNPSSPYTLHRYRDALSLPCFTSPFFCLYLVTIKHSIVEKNPKKNLFTYLVIVKCMSHVL